MGKRKTTTAEPVPANQLHLWQIQAVRDLLFVAAIIGVVWAGYALRAVTVPLLVALLLAYLFEPLIERMERHPRVSRPAAVTGLLATVGGGLSVLLLITIPLVVNQTSEFVTDFEAGAIRERIVRIQEYAESKATALRSVFDFGDDEVLPATTDIDGDAVEADVTTTDSGSPTSPATTLDEESIRTIVNEEVTQRLAELRASGGDGASGLKGWFSGDTSRMARGGIQTIARAVGAVVEAGLLAFLIPFYFFFFSVWYLDVLAFGKKLIPEKKRDQAIDLLQKMDHVVAGFVRGRIVISLIMGAMLAVGWLICGVPYAIVVGLVVGVFCAVPYLGTIGVPVAVGLLFADQMGLPVSVRMPWWGIILWPTLVFGIVQIFEGYVLTPKIAGDVTNLDPVTILVVVLAGGSVLGVYGMLLAIPLAACGKILFVEVLMPRILAWTRGEVVDLLPISRD